MGILDVERMCDEVDHARAGDLKRPILRLLLVHDYSAAAAAAELECSESYVYRVQAEFWQAVALREQAFRKAVLPTRPSRHFGLRKHAAALLQAMRGGLPSSPPTPTYDDNGRPVACRDPIVDVDRAVRCCLEVRSPEAIRIF